MPLRGPGEDEETELCGLAATDFSCLSELTERDGVLMIVGQTEGEEVEVIEGEASVRDVVDPNAKPAVGGVGHQPGEMMCVDRRPIRNLGVRPMEADRQGVMQRERRAERA